MFNLFENAVLSSYTGKAILVKFKHHSDLDSFPVSSFNMLITDSMVEYICDSETGEILFDCVEGVTA